MTSLPFRPRRPRTRFSVWLLPLSVAMLVAAGAAADDWPQWRGAGGVGVSHEARGLPETWGSGSDNVRWSTPLPGEGVSSPVTSNGRVFVTSAYEGQSPLVSVVLPAAVLLVAAAFVWLALRQRRRALEAAERGDATTGKATRKATRLLLGTSLFFVFFAVLIAVRPELFLETGNPGRAWRTGTALALLGLGAALGWIHPGSAGRVAGAGILLALSAVLLKGTPPGPKGPWPVTELLPFALPGLVAAAWGVVSFLRARKRPRPVAGGLYDPRLALPLLVLSVLVFVPPNYLNGLQRAVICLDLESGEILWERVVFQAPPEQKWPRNSYATPTPATDGERVFAYFGPGMAAVDFDGRIAWVKEFPDYTRHTRYGAGTSPVLTRDAVIVMRESEAFQEGPRSWYAAFDKDTGREIWRVESADAHDSYSTPLVLADEAGTRLAIPSWESFFALDAETGERLWSHPTTMQQVIASPARSGDLLAITGGEVGDRALMILRLSASDASAAPELVWQTSRGVSVIVSPVIYEGIVFNLTTGGILTAYDAETGGQLWKKRLDGEYFASLVAGDGKVYATNTEGATSVIAAAPEYELIAVNTLGEGVFASPAIVDGGLLLRSAGELTFVAGPGSGASEL